MKHLFTLVTLIFFGLSAKAQLPVSTTPGKKKAVIEEFTGIYCGFCPLGHKKAKEIKAANPGKVFSINVHTGGYARPQAGAPDYRTSFGAALASGANVLGYPTASFNRGGSTSNRGLWEGKVTATLGQDSYANIAAKASFNYGTRVVTVTTEVLVTRAGAPANLNLNVALLQDNILGPQSGMSYNPTMIVGRQYKHMHMLRHLITGQWGEVISPVQGTVLRKVHTYTIPANYNGVHAVIPDMNVVVFLTEGRVNAITAAKASNEYIAPAGVSLVDLAAKNQTVDAGTLCDYNITPKVKIENKGSNPVASYKVSVFKNQETVATEVKTITTALAVGANSTVTFSNLTLPGGNTKLKFVVKALGSTLDIKSINNTDFSDVILKIPSASSQTVSTGFESSPTGFYLKSNGLNTAIYNARVLGSSGQAGGFARSNQGLIFNCYGSPRGSSSEYISKKLDFSSQTGHVMFFDLAHAMYNSSTIEKLQVFVSTNCGQSWTVVYDKAGSELQTGTESNNRARFIPNSANKWRRERVNLSGYTGQSSVLVKFKATSAFGRSIYIDNIKVIDARTSSIDDNKSDKVAIYPNPAVESTTLTVGASKQATYKIYNQLGKVVSNEVSFVGTTTINTQNMSAGVYFVNVTVDGQTNVKRLTVIK